jgi:hypothetical protein
MQKEFILDQGREFILCECNISMLGGPLAVLGGINHEKA